MSDELCKCAPSGICGNCCERKLFDECEAPQAPTKTEVLFGKTYKYPHKSFRIDQIRVHAVAVDSEDSPGMREAAERAGHEYDEEAWQDLVVTLEDDAGNKFEVARVTVKRDGLEGSCTYVAELVCARSWGTEADDNSVSCPLCFHRGHGAGACERRR